MDNAGLTSTRVDVLRGDAMLEVTQLFKENNIQVGSDNATTTIGKQGLYEFDADRQRVAVFDGKAVVNEGDQHVDLKKGRETYVNAPLHAQSFDRNQHDELYNWSNVRSEYLAEAAAQSARTYVVNGGGWYGPGWYWNPWWSMYSFIPGDGILYSPFGWGYYSPGFVYAAPIYGFSRGRFATGGRVIVPGARAQAFHSSPAFSSPANGFARSAPAVRNSGGVGGGVGGGFHGGGRR